MNNRPKVSVVMANYNTPIAYLKQAIDSILEQSLIDFEFIIIDDNSSDESYSFIKSYDDDRIVLVRNSLNLGLTKSLNKGLGLAKGDYIARMDSDDISEKRRLEIQCKYLEEHKDTIACGTWIKHIGEWEGRRSSEYYKGNIPGREQAKIMLLSGDTINLYHPSAMFNNELLKKYDLKYDERFLYSQDYKMWCDCLKYGNLSIVPEVLLNYRIHNKSISIDKEKMQDFCTKQIMLEQLTNIKLNLNQQQQNVYLDLWRDSANISFEQREVIDLVISANEKNVYFDKRQLRKALNIKWMKKIYRAIKNESNFVNKLNYIRQLSPRYYFELIKYGVKQWLK